MLSKNRRSVLLASAACCIISFPAFAQSQDAPAVTQQAPAAGPAETPAEAAEAADAAAPASADGDDIIVTARKRDETSIAVPVAITAVGAAELQRRGISNIDAIARAVPALIVGEGGGTVQGGIIAIRGLSGADSNPFGDQAVSFVIDGVQVARATVRRMSEMDIQQVEVLKGPQALFFGKNSPAGIISIRTADPTSSLQAKIAAGYEFNAREIRTEAFISAPVTDTLGIRVAGFLSDMKGYSKYVGPTGGANVFLPDSNRAPNVTDGAGRVTLKWTPSDRFSARFKFAHSQVNGDSSTANVQFVACPTGAPQGGNIDNCRRDNRNTIGGIGPNFGRATPGSTFSDPRFGDGRTFLKQKQYLSGLELNYDVTDTLALTSVTGYYKVNLRNRANFNALYLNTGTLPSQILASVNFLSIREVVEELRLTSNLDGPVNFMLGGLYQDSHADTGSVTGRNANAPIYVNNFRLVQDGIAYSVFGQAMVDLLPQLELSVGARYSYEKKKLPFKGTANAAAPNTVVNLLATPDQRSFNNLSPEATLSYRPSRNMTVYGSYKEGFLSGGFNSGAANLAISNSYDQQLIKGFEAGIKLRLLDGALRTNLVAYNYETTGLQVTITTQGVIQELRNAGRVRTKGVEFDASYRTPLEGLTLNGAASYNRGRYADYQATCYRGQSSATCFSQVNRQSGQTAVLQDLSGTQLVRAPEWTGNLGFNYETPITSGLKLGLSGNASHSDGYFTDVTSAPGSFQRGYELYDATVTLSDADDRWEAAVIGRNLSNTYYIVRSTDAPFTGTAGGAALVGTRADTTASVSRGREVMLRLTYRFGG